MMNLLKRFLDIFPSLYAAALFLLIGRELLHSGPLPFWQEATFVLLGGASVIAVNLIFQEIENFVGFSRVWPGDLDVLRNVLMATVRSGHERSDVTTVEEWANIEEKLDEDSLVYTMTHDLNVYDLVPAAYRTTAQNILEGVNYVYLLDKNCDETAAKLLTRHIRDYLEEVGKLSGAEIDTKVDKCLIFRKLRIPLLYPFSIVKQPGKYAAAHWYSTEPMLTSEGAEETKLVVLNITDKERADELLNLFDRMQSVRFSYRLRV